MPGAGGGGAKGKKGKQQQRKKGKSGNPAKRAQQEREAAERAAGRSSAPGSAFGGGTGQQGPADLDPSQLPKGFEKFLGQ